MMGSKSCELLVVAVIFHLFLAIQTKAMPDEVQDNVGYALLLAQLGQKHDDTKPLKGFKGAGVLEVEG